MQNGRRGRRGGEGEGRGRSGEGRRGRMEGEEGITISRDCHLSTSSNMLDPTRSTGELPLLARHS